MNRFQKILVCISHPEADARRLQYVSALTRLAESKEVHLLHVVSGESGGGFGQPMGGGVTLQTLNLLAEDNLEKGTVCKDLCEIREGTPLLEILKYAHEKDIDLVVIGGGGPDPGHDADLARRITRKATCSVLVLPEGAPISAKKILVPIRDSECSANALETACRAAKATGGEVVALNVFRVHSDMVSDASLDDQIEKYRKLAEEESQSLLDKIFTEGIPVRIECSPNIYDRAMEVILDAIEKEGADLVAIGARGRTGAAGVLLGTTTEKLIRLTPIPLIAVKKKGEVFGVLDAIMTIAGQR
jgi:nucleotide-binding universal stress UspA family protein